MLSQEQLSLLGDTLTNIVHCYVKIHGLAVNARVQRCSDLRAMVMGKSGLDLQLSL